jgi:hypothetical protein
MRLLFALIALVGAIWAYDLFALDGRYGRAAWLEVTNQGQNFSRNLQSIPNFVEGAWRRNAPGIVK